MTSLNDQIADLVDEEAYWRGRAQRAEESARQSIVRADQLAERLEHAETCLESALAGLREFQEKVVEQREDIERLQRLVFDSQALLGHALGVVEDA